MREFVKHHETSFGEVYQALVAWLWQTEYVVVGEALDECSQKEIDRLNQEQPVVLNVRSPAWVAARLWDHGRDVDFDQWIAKWTLLGTPEIAIEADWQSADAERFIAAVLQASEGAGLVRWENLTGADERAARLAASGHAGSPEPSEPWIASASLLELHLWQRLHHSREGTEYRLGPATTLRLLLLGLAQRDVGPIPRNEMQRIMHLSGRHPGVLQLLVDLVHRQPRLLADMLLMGDGAVFATYLVATWPSSPSETRENALQRLQLQQDAFGACIKVLAALRDERLLDLGEFAHLFVQLQQLQLDADATRSPFLEACSSLAVELVDSMTQDQQVQLVNQLFAHAGEGVGSAGFAALLAVLVRLPEACMPVLADPAAAVYQSSIQPAKASLDLHFPTAAAARRFVDVLLKSAAGMALLKTPIDLRTYIAEADDDAKFSARLAAADALRSHIRLLCRAISTFSHGSVRAVLVDALRSTISAGALSHDEKGKVPAFSGFRDSIPIIRRRRSMPIAQEIALALAPMSDTDQAEVLNALVLMDEPKVLADLFQEVSDELKPLVERRINQLNPDEAAPLATIGELQATIHALMDAGHFEAAERFMKLEQGIDYSNRPIDFAVQHLRAKLRLLRHQERFDEILAMPMPMTGMSRQDPRQALQDTLIFYRGLVFLEAPGHIDPAKAVAAFGELQRRTPSEPAYAVNLLVARLNRLLPEGLVSVNQESKNIDGAETTLSDARKSLASMVLTGTHAGIYTVATAALELYVGRPREALRTLQTIEEVQKTPDAIALEAVVLNTLGYGKEGLVRIRVAEARFDPEDEHLKAARLLIESHSGQLKLLSGAEVLGPEQRLKIAIAELLQAPPLTQARVLSGPETEEPIGDYLTEVLRDSLASLASLVPALELDDLRRSEDHLNTVVREILRAKFSHGPRWTVADQSLGGSTKKRNMGERDIVIGRGSTDLAVIEAMKYSTSRSAGIASHAEKVSFYSGCEHFFNVIYSHEPSIQGILASIETITKKPAPDLALCADPEDLPVVGNQPYGTRARYRCEDGRNVCMTFLVVQLRRRIPI